MFGCGKKADDIKIIRSECLISMLLMLPPDQSSHYSVTRTQVRTLATPGENRRTNSRTITYIEIGVLEDALPAAAAAVPGLDW